MQSLSSFSQEPPFHSPVPVHAPCPQVIPPAHFLKELQERDQVLAILRERKIEVLEELPLDPKHKNWPGLVEFVCKRAMLGASSSELEALLEILQTQELPYNFLSRLCFVMLKHLCEVKGLKQTAGRMALTTPYLAKTAFPLHIPPFPPSLPWLTFLKNLLKIDWKGPLLVQANLDGIFEVYCREHVQSGDTDLLPLFLMFFCAQSPATVSQDLAKKLSSLFSEIWQRDKHSPELKIVFKQLLQWGGKGVFGKKGTDGSLQVIDTFYALNVSVWPLFIESFAAEIVPFPEVRTFIIQHYQHPAITQLLQP